MYVYINRICIYVYIGRTCMYVPAYVCMYVCTKDKLYRLRTQVL